MNIILYSILYVYVYLWKKHEMTKINFYYFMYYGIRYYILYISFLYMIDYVPNCLWQHSYMSQNTQIENHLFILVNDSTPHFPALEMYIPQPLFTKQFPFDVCLKGWRFSFLDYIQLQIGSPSHHLQLFWLQPDVYVYLKGFRALKSDKNKSTGDWPWNGKI